MPLKTGTKRRPSKKTSSKKNAVKGLSKTTRKAVATIAERVMNRKSETRYIAAQQGPYWTGIYGDVAPTGGLPQLFGCVPGTQQGDESWQRQGLKVNPVKHTTELRFAFNDDKLLGDNTISASSAGWDVTVHVWYGFCKRFRNQPDIQTLALSGEIVGEMLTDGQGLMTRFTGAIGDEMLAVNKEFVNLRHKKFRMYKNAGLANVLDTTSPSLSTPMSEAHRLTLTWKPASVLEYKAEDQLYPENYAPFIIVGYCHNDATRASYQQYDPANPVIANIPAIKMCKVDKLWYKDH